MTVSSTGRDTSGGQPPANSQYSATSWSLWGTSAQLVVAERQVVDGQTGGTAAEPRDEPTIDTARRISDEVLDRVDLACSNFRDDSDLARVNDAAGSWVSVDALLATVIQAAVRAAIVSDGLVDPTLGATIRGLGYDRDFAGLEVASIDPALLLPGRPLPLESAFVAIGPAGDPMDADPAAIDMALTDPTRDPAHQPWREIEVEVDTAGATGDPARRARVRIPGGTVLDLGAIGKAYAADAVASALSAHGIAGIISIGGDVCVAPGSTGHHWRVDISEAPSGPPQQSVVVELGAVATSTTTHRRWRHRGTLAHHIVDPRTGRPAGEVWRAVTVAAATTVDANTATTAAIVLGGQAVPWLRQFGLAARLVSVEGEVVTTGGWPAEAQP